MARTNPPASINSLFVHNNARPSRPRKKPIVDKVVTPEIDINLDKLEINITDFTGGTPTQNLQAAVNAAAALNRPAIVKLEHGVTYNLTATIAVPGNYILIDLNKAILTRSTNYGPTFTFGYDITSLDTYRYTFSPTGLINGTIVAAAGTMTTGYHLSFRRVWMPFLANVIIHNGNSGVEFRSCVETRVDNLYVYIIDRANSPSGRVGVWAGSHSFGDFPGAEHRWTKVQVWGGEPWRPEYVGPSLDFGILLQGGDGIWISDSHVAGTKLCNYQISTAFGHFVGNTTFSNCMSDWCHGQGLGLSATAGAIVNVRWHGWVSGGPSRFAAEKTATITKGASGTTDTLPDTYVGRVRAVFSGATTYDEGVSYIASGNTINWSPAGPEPVSGSTYSVSYTWTPLRITNEGQGIAITAPATTPETTWLMKGVDVSGVIENHSENAVFISSLNLESIKLYGLNITTNIARGDDAGGILIERGSDITVDNYSINGNENARYGIRVITNPPTGSGAIGVVDNVMIGTGRIHNCEWYGDEDVNNIPGIGLQVTAPCTNVVVDGCNARNNPTNIVERNSAFHNFPTIVNNSPGVNPLRYTAGWNPGTINPSGQVKLLIPASGTAYGDFIDNASFGMFIDDQIISYTHASIDTIVVRLENRDSTAATILSGVVTVDVLRKY
jgi:hypothetical protein